MSRFLRDTTVDEVGPGEFEAQIDPGWWIVAGPNGGYVAAIAARAVETAAGLLPDGRTTPLRSLTLHYLRRPDVGTVRVQVTAERRGRNVSTWSIRLLQGTSLVVVGLATTAASRPAPAFDDSRAPMVPPPEDVESLDAGPTVPMTERYEMRRCLGADPFARASESGSERGSFSDADTDAPLALTGGWIRLADPTPVDASVLVAIADAWWPAVFARITTPLAVPTVDLTVHLWQQPVDPLDWVLAEYRSEVAADGYLVEDARMFDRTGRLLATARQLAVFS